MRPITESQVLQGCSLTILDGGSSSPILISLSPFCFCSSANRLLLLLLVGLGGNSIHGMSPSIGRHRHWHQAQAHLVRGTKKREEGGGRARTDFDGDRSCGGERSRGFCSVLPKGGKSLPLSLAQHASTKAFGGGGREILFVFSGLSLSAQTMCVCCSFSLSSLTTHRRRCWQQEKQQQQLAHLIKRGLH